MINYHVDVMSVVNIFDITHLMFLLMAVRLLRTLGSFK